MREEKFRKLVHLYLDGEASSAEIWSLRAEIARHPQRRAIFRSCARFNRATRQAFSRLPTGSSEGSAVLAAPSPSFWRRGAVISVTASAVAACVAVAVLVIPYQYSTDTGREVAGSAEGAAAAESVEPREAAPPASSPQELPRRSASAFNTVEYASQGDGAGFQGFQATTSVFGETRDTRTWEQVHELMRQPAGLRMRSISDHGDWVDDHSGVRFNRGLWGQLPPSQQYGMQSAGFRPND